MALNPNAFVDEVMSGFSLHIEPPSYDTISAHVPERVLQFASEKLQYTGAAFI